MCDECLLSKACTRARPGQGRLVTIHPQERLLQAARALQASPQFGEYREKRQAAEHRLGRLIQLGVRQSRYFGQPKTIFQVMLAATVANLTLTATKTKKMRPGSGPKGLASFLLSLLSRTFEALLAHPDCPSWTLGFAFRPYPACRNRLSGWASRGLLRSVFLATSPPLAPRAASRRDSPCAGAHRLCTPWNRAGGGNRILGWCGEQSSPHRTRKFCTPSPQRNSADPTAVRGEGAGGEAELQLSAYCQPTAKNGLSLERAL